jgi:plasmid replication initiation protein
MADRKKTLELKKHVATIHSTNKLSLLQRKIANALLFNAYDKLLEENEHTVHIASLCKLIGYDSNDHKTIKKSLVNLLATVIEWNLVDGNKLNSDSIWNASSIIADASIDGAYCTYSYSNKMKTLLYRPELYGRLNMLVQAKFTSSYGLALYENCVRFQDISQTPWFELGKFRKLMGVEDGKYKVFRDFKNRVLDKAIEEVNKYSPMNITAQYRKQGRAVTAIQFLIKNNEVTQIDLNDKSDKNSKLSVLLKSKFGLSNKQIEDVISQFDEEYIREKMAIVEHSSSYLQGKITHVSRYFICALKDDYQAPKLKQYASPSEEFDKKERQKESIKKQYEDYQRFLNKEIINLFNKKTKREQNKILSDFEKFLGKGIYHDIFLRDGMKNILIQDQLCIFVKQNKHEWLNSIISFQDYCESKNIEEMELI